MENLRIAGYFDPEVPTIDSFPTFPLRRRSNNVRPTTPTFLSEPEAPVPTKPVVYSPVPTMRTLRGLTSLAMDGGASLLDATGWEGMESIVMFV